jgi:hypothetical protein
METDRFKSEFPESKQLSDYSPERQQELLRIYQAFVTLETQHSGSAEDREARWQAWNEVTNPANWDTLKEVARTTFPSMEQDFTWAKGPIPANLTHLDMRRIDEMTSRRGLPPEKALHEDFQMMFAFADEKHIGALTALQYIANPARRPFLDLYRTMTFEDTPDLKAVPSPGIDVAGSPPTVSGNKSSSTWGL